MYILSYPVRKNKNNQKFRSNGNGNRPVNLVLVGFHSTIKVYTRKVIVLFPS